MEPQKHVLSSIACVAVIGALAFLFTTSVYAFTEPTQAPPGANASAPFNVSANAQTKQGSITVNSAVTVPTLCLAGACRSLWPSFTGDDDWLFNSVGGVTHIYSGVSGSVGIGTNVPNYKLDVSGDIRATGMIYANANNQRYFQGGNDAALYDINVANTMGIYGVQDSAQGHIKLGSNGPTISGAGGNVGIGTAAPLYRLDVQGGQINVSGGLCINGDCKTGWSEVGGVQGSGTAGRVAKFISTGDTLGDSQIHDNESDVGIGGIPDTIAKLSVTNDGDHMIALKREVSGSIVSTARLRLGTDGALVVDSNGQLTLKLDDHSVFSYANIYAWYSQANRVGVGFGELQTMVSDFPGVPVYGLGWLAESGQIGALVPSNEIFGIYGASSNIAQSPTPAHLYITGDILSRDAGWTAPMRESSSGAGTVSGNSLQWRWAGAGTSGKLRLKTDNTQFIVPACSIGGNGFCSDAIEPAANLNTSPDFELRCTGNEVMRGIKWDSATGELSLICTR